MAEANTEALKALVDRQKLEEEKKNFELEKTRQIEEERKKIKQKLLRGQQNKMREILLS